MTPRDFAMWLSGAMDVVGERQPTPEEWAMIRVKSNEVIGELVAERMLEKDAYQRYLEHVAGTATWVYPYATTTGCVGTTTTATISTSGYAQTSFPYYGADSGSDCVATGLEEFKALSTKATCCEEDVCDGSKCG